MNQHRKETQTTKTFYRDAQIELRADHKDKEDRTFEFSFSSEFMVERVYKGKLGMELLEHSEEAVDLSRMNNSAPLLMNHDLTDQIGVVENASVNGSQMRGTVRFSKSQRAEEIMQDVKDLIRTQVSIGYSVNAVQEERSEEGQTIWRVTDFTPFEVSMVSVAADPEVGIGRAEEFETKVELLEETKIKVKEIPKMENQEDLDAQKARLQEMEDQAVKHGRAKEIGRIKEINETANKYSVDPALASRAIEEGTSGEAFAFTALESLFGKENVTPVAPSDTSADELDLRADEVQEYSLCRAINSVIENGSVGGYEGELSDQIQKNRGEQLKKNAFFVPFEITNKRFMQAGTAALGGDVVAEDLLGGSFIELLRNMTVVDKLGATRLDNLQGNVAIPRQDGSATSAWLAEGAAITASDQSLDQVLLTPKRLGALTEVTQQLITQSSIGIEQMIRNDILASIAIATDLGALEGTGASNQPTGILNQTGIGTVTFTTAATWAKILEFESDVSAANAMIGTTNFVTTAAVRGVWKAALKTTGVSGYLWEDSEVNGYGAMVSQQISGDKVFFGVWSQLLLASWSGMAITVDPYTKMDEEKIRLIINTYGDVGVRHPESFSISTDSGAL